VHAINTCIQRMQKVLTQMNIQLANVISDLSGWTGQRIIRAILAGERDPETLAATYPPSSTASRAFLSLPWLARTTGPSGNFPAKDATSYVNWITRQHVRVGVLEPGAVDTELESHNNDRVKTEIFEPFNEQNPKLEAEDIADGIAFMVTPAETRLDCGTLDYACGSSMNKMQMQSVEPAG
jgi:hypothetical protein